MFEPLDFLAPTATSSCTMACSPHAEVASVGHAVPAQGDGGWAVVITKYEKKQANLVDFRLFSHEGGYNFSYKLL